MAFFQEAVVAEPLHEIVQRGFLGPILDLRGLASPFFPLRLRLVILEADRIVLLQQADEQIPFRVLPFAERAAGIDIDHDIAFFGLLQGLVDDGRFPGPVSASTGILHQRTPLDGIGKHFRRVQDHLVEDAQPARLPADSPERIGHVSVGVGNELDFHLKSFLKNR